MYPLKLCSNNKNKLPESSSLDHTKVKAPYIREAGIIVVDDKNKIYKYDIRLIQPNSGLIPSPVLHSLEHLLAVTMRNYTGGIIDISPMGCQTGFYLITLNQSYKDVIDIFEKSLHDLLAFQEVPFANVIQCGSAGYHDLLGAKKYAQIMLDGKNNWAIGGKVCNNESNSVELY